MRALADISRSALRSIFKFSKFYRSERSRGANCVEFYGDHSNSCGDVPPCWILNFWYFSLTVGTLKRVKLHHHAKCRGERSNQCGNTVIFRFFSGGSRHLGFINFHNFNCRNAQEAHTALSFQISWRLVKLSRRYADFSIFPIWRLSAILDLWCAYLDHQRRAFGGLYDCAKDGWNRCSSFDNVHVFWFREFGLKMPIHAPKLGFWGTATKPMHRL